jgi:hypothetical protein
VVEYVIVFLEMSTLAGTSSRCFKSRSKMSCRSHTREGIQIRQKPRDRGLLEAGCLNRRVPLT